MYGVSGEKKFATSMQVLPTPSPLRQEIPAPDGVKKLDFSNSFSKMELLGKSHLKDQAKKEMMRSEE